MKKLYFLLFFFISISNSFSQSKIVDEIKKIRGIWIAEDFYNSFEKTGSHIKSKESFKSDYPVGLRINETEFSNGELNIGGSLLHDHLLHPEVEKYTVFENDTFYPQGYVKVFFKDSDTSGYHLISDAGNFNYSRKAYIKWVIDTDTSLFLYRPAVDNSPAITIKYKRIASSFSSDYLFPNPIYYYTRLRMLVGKYVLTNANDSILSPDFSITINGSTKGYLPFKNKLFYYSTDNYCGPNSPEDNIRICDSIRNYYMNPGDIYIYKRLNDNTIYLYKWDFDDSKFKVNIGNLVYKLERINN